MFCGAMKEISSALYASKHPNLFNKFVWRWLNGGSCGGCCWAASLSTEEGSRATWRKCQSSSPWGAAGKEWSPPRRAPKGRHSRCNPPTVTEAPPTLQCSARRCRARAGRDQSERAASSCVASLLSERPSP